MADEDLSSSESDADYVPFNDEDQAVSEDESDSEVEDELIGNNNSNRKRKGKRKEKISKKRFNDQTEKIDTVEEKVDEETLKKRTDDLWTDFKSTAEIQTSKSSTLQASTSTTSSNINDPVAGEEKTVTKITKTYEFAGEKVEVVEPAVPMKNVGANRLPNRRGGGITSVLGQLGKKTKLSTLEKSKLDWESYKRAKGVAEEIETHNRGKHGYLEKQDFLMRTDLRQFELEKRMRETSRRNNP